MRTALYIPIFILSLEKARIFNNFARDSLGSLHVPWKICSQRISMLHGQFTLSTHLIIILPNQPRPKCFSSFRPHGAEGKIYLAPGGRENESTGNEIASQD